MDEFIQGTVLKDYPDMTKITKECGETQNEEENPSVVKVTVDRKTPLPQKQSNQVCYFYKLKFHFNIFLLFILKLLHNFLFLAYEEVKKKLQAWYKPNW